MVKKLFFILISIFLLSSFVVATSFANQIFFDDFQDGTADGWTPYPTSYASRWNTIDDGSGNIVYWADGRPGQDRFALNDFIPSTSNYRVSADVKIVRGESGSHHGVFGHASGVNDGYGFGIYDGDAWGTDDFIILFKLEAGVSTVIESSFYDDKLNDHQWYNIGMEFLGDTITCYIDDTRVLSVSGYSSLGNQFGVLTWGGGTYFDDVTVSPVPEPATILLVGVGLVGIAGARRKLKKK